MKLNTAKKKIDYLELFNNVNEVKRIKGVIYFHAAKYLIKYITADFSPNYAVVALGNDYYKIKVQYHTVRGM